MKPTHELTASDTAQDITNFEQLYQLRETLRLQLIGATEAVAPVYATAIDSASAQLSDLAPLPSVQQHLERVGGVAVRGFMELALLSETGLVPKEIIDAKKEELERGHTGPELAMAMEFLQVASLPESAPVRRTATEGQVSYGQSLGLAITAETPAGKARAMIDAEVRKQSKAVLKTGKWCVYKIVTHPRYGDCEITKIHEDIAKVTLAPVDGGRKIVVAAMHLPHYQQNLEQQQ